MGIAAWLGLVVCVGAGGAATLAWARRLGVLRPAIVALAVQGLLTVSLYFTVGLWAPDAGYYDTLGREFADYWAGGPDPSEVGMGKEAFPMLLGAIYYVAGPAPAIGLALNWAAHGLLVPTLASLAKRLELPVVPTAWVIALFPPALLWSSFLLRESITWLLMAVFLCAVAGLARRFTLRDMAVMVAGLASLLWFRGTAALIVGGVAAAVLVLTARRGTFLRRVGVASVALLVLSPRITDLLAGYLSVDDLEAKRTDLNNADTTFAEPPPPATAGEGVSGVSSGAGGEEFVMSLIDSALRVAFGPYPWEWPALGTPFAFDGVVWLSVLGLALVTWWRAPNRVGLLLLVLPALALSGALMITSGNYGTMQRLRVQTSVLLIPLAASSLSLLITRVRGRRGLVGPSHKERESRPV